MYMSLQIPQIATIKNQWLSQQVDVEFPTQESLKGREIYQNWVNEKNYVDLSEYLADDSQLEQSLDGHEIYLVDFHRLTVMFALLQAQRWQDEVEQELIVEFLTQIIYSEPCQLYLGFKNGEPTASAIVTVADEQVLISDVFVLEDTEQRAFLKSLLSKDELSDSLQSANKAFLEI